MAYAVRDDVLARAGLFAGVFQVVGKRPNEADLDAFIEDVADIIDADIRSRGFDPALLTPEIEGALRDVNAWAVLLRALPAAVPGNDADELLDRAREIVVAAGFPALAAGSVDVFGVLAAIEAGQGGGGASSGAGSLWDEIVEPEDDWTAEEVGEASLPTWRRGQPL